MQENSKIIAYITLREYTTLGEIGLFAVLKKYQRKGVGKKLLKYILQIAKKNNLKRLSLEVRNDNIKALSLYLKYGFIIIGVRKVKSILKLKMEKELS